MIEKKFRVWDTENKVMCIVYRLEWTDNKLFADCVPHLENIKRVLNTEKNPLMQYIGLKVNNKKEMYEEDIVKHYHEYMFFKGEVVGVIEWSNSLSAFVIDYPQYGCSQCIADIDLSFAEIEIIGNTYQNLELLEDN